MFASETTTEAEDWELAHELYRRHSADLSSSLRTRGPSSLSAILAQCVRLATRGSDQAAIVLEEPGKKTKQKKPVLPPGWRIRLPPGWRIPRSGEKEKQLRSSSCCYKKKNHLQARKIWYPSQPAYMARHAPPKDLVSLNLNR